MVPFLNDISNLYKIYLYIVVYQNNKTTKINFLNKNNFRKFLKSLRFLNSIRLFASKNNFKKI